jgi:N-carbamoyl-L-amino-acid hydrolase
VRNDRGSHNPDEKMDLEDFMMGVEVLYQAVTAQAGAAR